MITSCDVAIIGAGTAGLSALREVRRRTGDFVIINDGPYGTTCARVGCMSSKALIESANAFHRRTMLKAFGVNGAEGLSADIPAVLRRVRRLRDDFVAGILGLTAELGPRSIAGRARFVGPDVLEVNGRRLRAKTIIIAAGSRPIVPESWRALGRRVLTSDELFEQTSLPQRMAVVGLGAIGTEIAQALARLGIEISAVGSNEYVAGLTDPQVNAQALALLGGEFKTVVGQPAELERDDDRVRVHAGAQSCVVDAVLAALGRRPNVDGLGLEHLGIALDEHGMPPFDRQSMQIADLPIFIAGDVSADLPVLHEANDEGHISGYNALRETPNCLERRTPLAIVFTDPNIATVGMRFDQLRPDETLIGTIEFSHQGRARIAAENHGLLRVYASKREGRLLGAELCAPRGEHLAHLLALAIQQGLTVQDLLRMPFYHPVIEEGLRSALRDLSRQLSPLPRSDLASCDPVGAEALD